MAEITKTMNLFINTKTMQADAKAATVALKGLDKVLSSVAEGIRDAFTIHGTEDYKNTVKRFGKELADELLVLQLRFGKLKVALAQALAPIASVIVPILNDAMQAVIRFSGFLGQFLRGLIAGTAGNQKFTKSTQDATQNQKKLAAAVKGTGKAIRRSLAGFDQLDRLNLPSAAASGGSSGINTSVPETITHVPDTISPQVQAMVDKVLQILEPLRQIDWTPLQQALQSLGAAFSRLGELAGKTLKYLWFEILTPFAAWVAEVLAPALAEGWAAKLTMVAAALEPVMAGLKLLWEALQPVVAYISEVVVLGLQNWKKTYLALAQTFQEKNPVITGIFQNIAQMATGAWSVVGPVLKTMKEQFAAAFDGILAHVTDTVGHVLDSLYGLTEYLSGVFSGDWKKAWNGIKSFLKSVVNGIIGLLNTMIARLVAALNAVIKAANKLSFTLPSWIPELGGKTFGLNLKTVSAPQIPYLAQGAVLPANKPFLAMVGDQKHGTNVEAPLATIQEAVAGVMADQTGAILAGFEASVGIQKEILEAVLGIQIGDEVLGRAVDRYHRRMAIIQGGY